MIEMIYIFSFLISYVSVSLCLFAHEHCKNKSNENEQTPSRLALRLLRKKYYGIKKRHLFRLVNSNVLFIQLA